MRFRPPSAEFGSRREAKRLQPRAGKWTQHLAMRSSIAMDRESVRVRLDRLRQCTLRHFVPIWPVLAADSTTNGIQDVQLAGHPR
jgi:hypothetical protein